MLKFTESPTPAFNAAVAQLDRLRSFSPSIEQQLDLLTSAVTTTRFKQLDKMAADRPGHEWRVENGASAYLRPDTDHDQPGYRPSPELLREKILSDIMQDLRLPHTAAALVSHNSYQPGMPNAILSLVAANNIRTMEEIILAERKTDFRYNLLRHKPGLSPAFAALSVADIWIGNFDRMTCNIITDAKSKNADPTSCYGIDLNKICFQDEAPGCIFTRLGQKAALNTLNPDLVIPAINTTLAAIENYPLARLLQLAGRVQPYAGDHDFAAEMHKLHSRQPVLRQALGRNFPDSITWQIKALA